jgi:hypothetical protein
MTSLAGYWERRCSSTRQGFKVRTSLQEFKFGTYNRDGMKGFYESLNCEGGPGVMNYVEGLPFTGDVVAVLWKTTLSPYSSPFAPLDRAEKDAPVRLWWIRRIW